MSARKNPKTYWHLKESQRMPSRYDVVTSKLLYYPDKGFSVKTPVVAWYERCVGESPIPTSCYARFSDPRALTYRQYVHKARDQEVALQGAFDAALALNQHKTDEGWVGGLRQFLPALPFFFHGMQMQAAYCAQLAPEGKLVVAWTFKTANGMRRIQSVSRRIAALDPEFDWNSAGREAWQSAPAWQPLRELTERLLVAYDLGEAWVASMLVVEPVFDRLLFVELPRLAGSAHDALTAHVFQSLRGDATWHAEVAAVLYDLAWASGDVARRAIEAWIAKWWPWVDRALSSVLECLAIPELERRRIWGELCEERRQHWAALGMSGVGV